MSGIYIPNTEMPDDCLHCPCADLEYMDCNLMPGSGIGYKKRLDDCPLIPVPEHGDLIDKQYAYQNTMTLGEHTRKIVLKQIDALPVVIPADKLDYLKERKPKTNADRIRSSSDEKLAVICEDGCPPGAPICNSVETIEGETTKEHCQRCWLSWLKAPADKEEK